MYMSDRLLLQANSKLRLTPPPELRSMVYDKVRKTT